MAKHKVRFNIKGKNINPESIGMGELAELLKHLNAAIAAAVPSQAKVDHADEGQPLVSLVSIHEGQSSDLVMMIPDYGISAISDITTSIAGGDFGRLPLDAHESLRLISRWASDHRVSVEFEPDATLSISHAIISRKHPVPSPAKAGQFVQGVTTAWGYLVRVGGKEPRAALEFPDGTRVVVRSDEQVAKLLGERLYENVGIEGIATWRLPEWKMVAFKAIRPLDYRPKSTALVDTFAKLSEASQGRWDDVDAEQHVIDSRGET